MYRADSRRAAAESREVGFTLVELLVAMTIFLVAILGTAGLVASNIRGNLTAKHITQATILAQDGLEEVRRAGWDDVDALAGTETYGTIIGFSEYKRVTQVQNDVPKLDMKTISVTVSWLSDAKNMQLATIIAKQGKDEVPAP